jgi:(2R)-3-sulfolactate dehydrogenase (NADP+)
MPEQIVLGLGEARDLATRACVAVGADTASTNALVAATLSAALNGRASVGFPHMLDYLASFARGQINRAPKPTRTRVHPGFIASDADRGVAQLGFDLGFEELVDTAHHLGVAAFCQKNSYTTGELGYYVRRLAKRGLVALAATNAHAVMVSKPRQSPVYSTNPLAFGFPLGDGCAPLVIDQSSSETALVNLMAAAKEGRHIPEGWAVDSRGVSTTDPVEALAGALLPFGAQKGANIALMVEMMSAGLSGGSWSVETPNFSKDSVSPAVGLTIIVVRPGDGLVMRAKTHVDGLDGAGVFIPGVSSRRESEEHADTVAIESRVLEALMQFADAA